MTQEVGPRSALTERLRRVRVSLDADPVTAWVRLREVGRSRWSPRVVAVAGLVAFIVMERRLRRGSQAATLEVGPDDRGSTMAVGAAFGVAMTLAPAASRLRVGRLPTATAWAGTMLMGVAIATRAWAASTLGASYTRTLMVTPGQTVVDSGPYAVIRHPGYAADVLMWLGYGLAWASLPAMVVATGPTAASYIYRIGVEESMLRTKLGHDYEAYAGRTWRLIPGIW